MIWPFKRSPERQSGPRIAPHVIPAVMLMDAAKALTGPVLCRVVYTALADKTDIPATDLEALSNRLGRLAHERGRT
jgi:hypothetical protein